MKAEAEAAAATLCTFCHPCHHRRCCPGDSSGMGLRRDGDGSSVYAKGKPRAALVKSRGILATPVIFASYSGDARGYERRSRCAGRP